MNLNAQQHDELLHRLQHDYEFKDGGEYFHKGVCPECGKRELFISKEQPWQLCCNRRNKCGFTASTFDLYRHSLFADWSKHYSPTENNPNATADAYMHHARGFDLDKVRHLYTQEYFAKDGYSTATVRFLLSDGKAKWERLIDHTDRFGGQKGRALGSYKGLWWQMPEEDFSEAETVWITEGIFDALSLIHAGHIAIASISCSHYPSGFFEWLQEKNYTPKIIFALDSDIAGRENMEKHVALTRKNGFEAKAAIPPPHHDWNDLWRSGKLDDRAITEARYQGDLLLACSAADKARIIYHKSGMDTFPFVYAQSTYWFSLDQQAYQTAVDAMEAAGTWNGDESSKDEAFKQAGVLKEIANCAFSPLYFQKDRYGGNEARYFVRVSRPHGVDVLDTFTGTQIGSAADFKKRLLGICPGALFEGSGKQLDRIIKTDFTSLRMVETIDYTGYVRELDAWIYRDFAISSGKVLRRNDEYFIALDRQSSIKTNSDVNIHLNDSEPDFRLWKDHLWHAFGEKGLVALAFFTGSLFVDQIRQKQKSWPFLEITGDAGTGKTTLIQFLWCLLGRADYEGFDPGKSSFIGRSRAFNKTSGFPVVLIESDHSASPTHSKKFEFGELKDLYNGRPIYTRAEKSSGLETYDPPFRGSIVIAQNNRVEADEAVLSRIVPLVFIRKNMPSGGKLHADALNRLSVDVLASYLVYILRRGKSILKKYFEIYHEFEERLLSNSDINMSRIAQNGAQIMAILKVVAEMIGFEKTQIEQTINFIEAISVERQKSLAAEHPVLTEFWDSFDYLNALGGNVQVNHSAKSELLAVNLPQLEACARQVGIQMPLRTEINRLIPQSCRYEYIGKKNVRSKINGAIVKCHVFLNKKIVES